MQKQITRKEFLSGFLSHFRQEMGESTARQRQEKQINFLFLPGIADLDHFVDHCTQCYECVAACPHQAIRVLRDQSMELYAYPVIMPREQPCYICSDFPCIAACAEGALSINFKDESLGSAVIDPGRCFSYQGNFCQACINNCPEGAKAIHADHLGRPVIEAAGCSGCGQCAFACPAEIPAIRVESRWQEWKKSGGSIPSPHNS